MGSAVSDPPPSSSLSRARPFEQARVHVEDVARIRLATGRPTQQQRQLAVGAGVAGEVVVHDQHVTPLTDEELRHARCGVGRDEPQPHRVVTRRDDHDGPLEHVLCLQACDDLGDGARALADRAVHRHDVAVTLVEDRVERDAGLARLAVADDQLTLTATDRDQRVDGLDAGLQRCVDRRPVVDRRGLLLDVPAALGADHAAIVEGTAGRVDDAAEQFGPDRCVHHPTGAVHAGAGADRRVRVEQQHPDLVGLQFEHQTQPAVFELHDLLEADTRHPDDSGDTFGDLDHLAPLGALQPVGEPIAAAVERVERDRDGAMGVAHRSRARPTEVSVHRAPRQPGATSGNGVRRQRPSAASTRSMSSSRVSSS
jgi:hypothetical protein